MQWEGEDAIHPALLGLHRKGEEPVLCELPDALSPRMKGYAGSVAFEEDGRRVAITCPKGGVMAVFDQDGWFIDMPERADVCGIGAAPGAFMLTDGLGGVIQLSSESLTPLASFELVWDNHLISV